MLKITEEVNDILELGYSISTERYYFKLFDLILDGCMKFTNADGGNLYIEDRGRLKQLTFVNRSLGLYRGRGGEPIDNVEIDINSHNLMAYTASHKVNLNIADIYKEKKFEVLSIKEFDVVHNYRTKSLLTVPIFEQGKSVLGVMQLTNCMDDDGNVIPFPEPYVKMVNSLTAQMAMALTNMLLIQDLEELLRSFVASLTTAIDARTPYNANHTKNVAKRCIEMMDYINQMHKEQKTELYFSDKDKRQMYLAAMLHDIGKMDVPLEIMDKPTKLGHMEEPLRTRLEIIILRIEKDALTGRLTQDEAETQVKRIREFLEKLGGFNCGRPLKEDEITFIDEMGATIYRGENGEEIPYLTQEELDDLHIKAGTLSENERTTMQSHVIYTDKILNHMYFGSDYKDVRRIAANHHELLNGKGYPIGLGEEELDVMTRILTIMDIYDSLIADDRPYKKPKPVKVAFDILDEEAEAGKIDKELLAIAKEIWLKDNQS